VLVSGPTPGFRSRAQGILAVDCEYQPLDFSPEDCESRSSSDCHMVMLSFKVWMEHLLETICPPTSRQLGLRVSRGTLISHGCHWLLELFFMCRTFLILSLIILFIAALQGHIACGREYDHY
jgi:hypothetical protein